MALSRLAAKFADEIIWHDWQDATSRADRAGHHRHEDSHRSADDKILSAAERETLRLNVVWVTAQVLAHEDPNFNIMEYAIACGVPRPNEGYLNAGLRRDATRGYRYSKPGSWDAE